MRYLADDESMLPEDPALRRGFGATHFGGQLSGLNREVWDLTWSLPFEFEPKAWESLLLDAEAVLPEVGPSIMVAYSALETFITWALDELVVRRALPKELWEWINDRGHHEKDPSVAERFDILLKVLTGKSLKDENTLWQQFQSLRKARNSFSHEGRGVLDEREMTAQEGLQCISHTKAIVDWVENLLPKYLSRPRIGRIKWNLQIGI